MSITAWRIFKPKHAAMAFTGAGAREFGGRWNGKGTAIVYTAGSASLAALEILVHVGSHELLEAYQLCEITLEDALVEKLDGAKLPGNWQSEPAPAELKQIGDTWASSNSSAALRVPSAVVETEFNYLLNPSHPDFARIRIGAFRPFRFDPRLIR
ncbi:MAG: RES domain-containing protein [Pirellulales bacterium]